MRSTATLFLLTAAAFATAAERIPAFELAPGQVLIELHPNVLSKNHIALLGDVASIRTADLDAIRRLVQLPIGRAPRPGAEAVVRQQDLARWVHRQTSLPHERLVWAGANEVRVRTATGQQPSDVDATGATRTIHVGEPVRNANKQAAAIVGRGDWVNVLYRSGSVELGGRAQALQEGRMGQVVQVKSAGAAGSIAARIVGTGQVEALQ